MKIPEYAPNRRKDREETHTEAPVLEQEKKYTCAVNESLLLPVEKGTLIAFPSHEAGALVVESGKGTCWCATLRRTPDDPSFKTGRHFWWKHEWNSKKKVGYALPVSLRLGDALEFGANLFTVLHDGTVLESSVAERIRWYGVVREITPDFLKLERCRSEKSALRRGEVLRKQRSPSQEELQINALVSSFYAGDTLALCGLLDFLKDREHPCSQLLHDGLQDLVHDLFPHVPTKQIPPQSPNTDLS